MSLARAITCYFLHELSVFGDRSVAQRDADYYREQAKRMRRIAANAAALDITMQLVAVAQEFERLAAFVAKEEPLPRQWMARRLGDSAPAASA
jgi:hypothetical protein